MRKESQAKSLLSPPPHGGRDRERGLFQRLCNNRQNTCHIRQNLGIPKANDAKTLAFQERRTHSVAFDVQRMLPAIEFDHQPMATSGKIGNIGTNGNLPCELHTRKSFGPQFFPQCLLGNGQSRSHLTGMANRCMISLDHVTHPLPSLPLKGEGLFESSYA